MANTFLEIYLYVVIAVHLIVGEVNGARLFGAVRLGLEKAKMHDSTPLLWMKDGCRILWAHMFAKMEFMMKALSEMKLIKSGLLAPIF